MKNENPLISTVFVNWNRCALLQAAIQSLQAQQYPAIEYIVVDNGSTDHSVAWLRQQPDVILIENTKNLGASKARNQGTAMAQGAYVLYMDSDAELLTPGGLARLVAYLEAHPRIAGASGGIYTDRETTQIWCYSPCTNWEGIYDPVQATTYQAHPAALSTCFALFRRNVVEAVGGFDEFYFYLFEDGDLCQRIGKMGYGFYLDPAVRIVHHYAEPGRTKRGEIEFHYYHEWLRHYYLLSNWGLRRLLGSLVLKWAHPCRMKTQFGYLSWIHYIDIYFFRILLLFFCFFYGRVKDKKWRKRMNLKNEENL